MMLAAQLDDQDTVTQVIVCGSVQWALAAFGGRWVAGTTTDPDEFPGIGYQYNANDGTFTPPPPTPIEPESEPTP
jgi:hypothetical protein